MDCDRICKSNKPFPLRVAFGHGLYLRNRKQTRTLVTDALRYVQLGLWGSGAPNLCFSLRAISKQISGGSKVGIRLSAADRSHTPTPSAAVGS